MQPLLSIIVPIYKVEKYLRKCLNSIFSQDVDISLYEVILVNDGTPDNSMNIVSEFSAKYTNLRVLNQTNQGLSVARNNGMKIASGDYFWFVDSDDTIVSGGIKKIVDIISSNQVDVVAMLLQKDYELTGKIEKCLQSKYLAGKGIVSGYEYLNDEGKESPAQLFVMRRSFLEEHNLSFYPYILHEDIQFCLRMLYFAKSIYLLNDNIYNYLIRTRGSITSDFSIRNCKSYLEIAKSLFDFREKFVEKRHYKCYSAVVVKYLLSPLYKAKSNKEFLESDDYKRFVEDYCPYITKNISFLLDSRRLQKNYFIIYFKLRFFYNYFSFGKL